MNHINKIYKFIKNNKSRFILKRNIMKRGLGAIGVNSAAPQ